MLYVYHTYTHTHKHKQTIKRLFFHLHQKKTLKEESLYFVYFTIETKRCLVKSGKGKPVEDPTSLCCREWECTDSVNAVLKQRFLFVAKLLNLVLFGEKESLVEREVVRRLCREDASEHPRPRARAELGVDVAGHRLWDSGCVGSVRCKHNRKLL